MAIKCKRFLQWVVCGGGLFLSLCAASRVPPLAAETLSEETLQFPLSPHSVLIYDEAFNNETDARLILFDADHNRKLGQMDAGYYPNITVAPDHRNVAIATTYWSRGGHGARTDVIEFWDLSSLRVTSEIVLPSTRLQGPPTLYHLAYSADQRFLYSHALTPAAAWTVIDLKTRQVVGDVDSDGCVQMIPSLTRRLTGICESGRLLSVTLDENGHEVSRQLSDVFFNDAVDPVFVQAIPTPTGVIFLSHHGQVHEVDLSTAAIKLLPAWSLRTVADQAWRPGGTQLGAIHAARHRLYVQMHIGGNGSHKEGGKEIWVYDTQSHQRVARWPVNTQLYGDVIATHVTADDHPLLILATSLSKILTLDAVTGRLLPVKDGVGQTPWYMVNP